METAAFYDSHHRPLLCLALKPESGMLILMWVVEKWSIF